MTPISSSSFKPALIKPVRHLVLLTLWLTIAVGLRCLNLAAKPPSTIEIATLGFSLGHGFQAVPLNQVIDLATLLKPLQIDPTLGVHDTLDRLMSESTHPPIYFLLTHVWLHLFSGQSGVVSLGMGRLLSALLGALAVPALFGWAWIAFESLPIAHFAAVLMAVSPFGIYLAQEARHYTLAVLWIIASLACLSSALKRLRVRSPLPKRLVALWVAINALGMATHYFFGLLLGAEGGVLAIVGLLALKFAPSQFKPSLKRPEWRRLAGAVLGSTIAAIVWVPAMHSATDNQLTQWIHTSFGFNDLLEPIGRLAAWLISMVAILPVEEQPIGVIIPMAIILLLLLGVLLPLLVNGWRIQLAGPHRHSLLVVVGIVLVAIGGILLAVYGRGTDLTVAPRYHFVYFPAVLLLVAAALATLWQQRPTLFGLPVRPLIGAVVLLALVGGLTVGTDLSFKKSKRPDRLVTQMQSAAPGLLVTAIDTHAEVRAAVAIAYEWHQLVNHPPLNARTAQLHPQPNTLKFLLYQAKPLPEAAPSLVLTAIDRQPRPFELWTIGKVSSPTELATRNCQPIQTGTPKTYYRDRHYHCG